MSKTAIPAPVHLRNTHAHSTTSKTMAPHPISRAPIPNHRPNRINFCSTEDTSATCSFGSSIFSPKHPSSLRIFFQNVKGISHSTDSEDYKYLARCLQDIQVDISGLAETNTAWQHPFLRSQLSSSFRRYTNSNMAKISFASPTHAVDAIPPNETYQAGGSITIATGSWATAIAVMTFTTPLALADGQDSTYEGSTTTLSA